MRNLIFYFLISFCLLVFGLEKPINYVATNGASRGVQQQVTNFAAWNITSGNWNQVLPPRVSTGSIAGIVAIGDGLLAYGSFNFIGTRTAAGLAYYDGSVWSAPEGVGLYSITVNTSYSYYDNIPSNIGSAFAAVVNGNTVYLLGSFDQVGNLRDGVNGFVALNWSPGGIFTPSKIGNGYYKTPNTIPQLICTTCPADTQPATGNRNKLRYYTTATAQYFVLQPGSTVNGGAGDLFQWQVNTGFWVQITNGNGAINITGNVADFEVVSDSNPSIYIVGNFQRLNDPVASFRYMHIAVSNDQGATFQNVPPVLDVNSFGNIPQVINQTTGVPIYPALTNAVGFFSIAIPNGNRNSIYVGGGYRVNTNNRVPTVAYSNEMQTVVMQLTPGGITYLSGRFQSSTTFSPVTTVNIPRINQLTAVGQNLYIFGGFNYYNQYIQEGNPVNRFNIRYTEVYKGAAVLNLASNTISPAFGGFITSSNTDTSPTLGTATVFSAVSTANNIVYFASTGNQVSSTYNLLTGAMFAYGGDAINNQTNKWNPVLSNRRFVTNFLTGTIGNPFPYIALPAGQDGIVYSLHITLSQDVVVFGGLFDFIGTSRVPGIGFYNPDTGTFGSVGGGLFFYDQTLAYQADSTYYNRLGGRVYDITERDGLLFAAGLFNRNNSGSPLYNIACIPFRTGGAGWLQVDGGCDGRVNDLLINGNLLYATGSFSFCGLNPEGYKTGGLNRGRVPTSGIAVIDLSLSPSEQSWRPLGIGLQGTATGKALAWYKGQLYVGGTFSSAGGAIYSDNIARWDGNRWRDVVSDCLLACDRSIHIYPFMMAEVPSATERKPTSCQALSTLNGNLYCITPNVLNWYDGSYWRKSSNDQTVVNPTNTFQNNLIANNGSNSKYIVISGGASQLSPAGRNYYSFNTDTLNYEPSFTGFSNTVNSIVSSANTN